MRVIELEIMIWMVGKFEGMEGGYRIERRKNALRLKEQEIEIREECRLWIYRKLLYLII